MKWFALLIAIVDLTLAFYLDNLALAFVGVILVALFAYVKHQEDEVNRQIEMLKRLKSQTMWDEGWDD